MKKVKKVNVKKVNRVKKVIQLQRVKKVKRVNTVKRVKTSSVFTSRVGCPIQVFKQSQTSHADSPCKQRSADSTQHHA